MKRVFIAIDISDEARAKVAAYIEDLRRSAHELRVGWERPEKLHLTIKFLGDVDDRHLNDIEQAVKRLAANFVCFRSEIKGTGQFPPKGDPRILWLGVEDRGSFSEIARSLDRELANAGFEPEKRRFSPHLTIARLREPSRSRDLAVFHERNKFEPVGFEVREIAVYESRLLPKGSVYTKIGALRLKEN